MHTRRGIIDPCRPCAASKSLHSYKPLVSYSEGFVLMVSSIPSSNESVKYYFKLFIDKIPCYDLLLGILTIKDFDLLIHVIQHMLAWRIKYLDMVPIENSGVILEVLMRTRLCNTKKVFQHLFFSCLNYIQNLTKKPNNMQTAT